MEGVRLLGKIGDSARAANRVLGVLGANGFGTAMTRS